MGEKRRVDPKEVVETSCIKRFDESDGTEGEILAVNFKGVTEGSEVLP